jgi:hypothetical protein
MLKIFVLLPCLNNRFIALYFNNGKGMTDLKTKVNLNHYIGKLNSNYRLKS